MAAIEYMNQTQLQNYARRMEREVAVARFIAGLALGAAIGLIIVGTIVGTALL